MKVQMLLSHVPATFDVSIVLILLLNFLEEKKEQKQQLNMPSFAFSTKHNIV